jgi:3-phosphoshikimate 1-carboxyvinyltransferase
MNAIITKGILQGEIPAVSSKSYAHRLLIAAALSDGPTEVACRTVSEDILATAGVLNALGAKIERTAGGFSVTPVETPAEAPILDCGESGTTERFILPVVLALGANASIIGRGRLAARPLSPLYEELCAHGAKLSPQGRFPLDALGRIGAGHYSINAGVSSQFVGGLLFALSLLPGRSFLELTGKIESKPYIGMTLDVLRLFGASIVPSSDGRAFSIEGKKRLHTPGRAAVEGDWSNAAFWLAAGALGGRVRVTELSPASRQGDMAVIDLLKRFGAKTALDERGAACGPGDLLAMDIDASQIPDLVPVLAVVAAVTPGTTRISGASRLRLKESDRLKTVHAMLAALGGRVTETEDGLVIEGQETLKGGTVDGANDHRIVMAAAVASARCTAPVVIRGAEAVRKSYPGFFGDFALLGGAVSIEN